MIVWPSWLWIGTRFKFFLWLGNRFATWTGTLYLWRRMRASRFFWLWLVLINAISLGCLGLLFYWLHTRAHHG